MTSWTLAADEYGILSIADTRAAGLTAKDVAALTRSGELTSLSRGWYAVSSPGTPEARHVLLTRAVLRAHEGRAVAAHHSALCMLGLPTFRADLTTVCLSRRSPGPNRTRKGLKLGRCVPAEALGAATVVPAMAVAQAGASCGPLAGLVAADAALHKALCTKGDLDLALGWVRRHPGTGLLTPFLELADGRRESPGETRLAHAFHLMKLSVTPQARIEDRGFLAFADFLLDDWPVVVEFDGMVKYGRKRDAVDRWGNQLTPQQVLVAEKRREDRIRELGYQVVRVVWSELDDPAALARRIRAAINRARASAAIRSA